MKNEEIDKWLRIVSFKEAGHYAFKSYPEIIDEEVLKLVSKTWLGQQQPISSNPDVNNLEPLSFNSSTSVHRKVDPAKIFQNEENEIKIDNHKDEGRKIYAVNFKSSKY